MCIQSCKKSNYKKKKSLTKVNNVENQSVLSTLFKNVYVFELQQRQESKERIPKLVLRQITQVKRKNREGTKQNKKWSWP